MTDDEAGHRAILPGEPAISGGMRMRRALTGVAADGGIEPGKRLMYLMSCGLTEEEAMVMSVCGNA